MMSHDCSPHASHFLTVSGVKLHYLDWGGQGDPLLFLTGNGHSAHIYDDIAPKLTDRFRVLGLTRRGHGRSDKPESGYDTGTLVEDIRQVLDALHIERASLVGHSLAGAELTRFAGLYPARVDKLVYLDAGYDRFATTEIHASFPVGRPSRRDRASFEAYRDWRKSLMGTWSEACEADLREITYLAPDGTVMDQMPDWVQWAIMQGAMSSHPDYTKIQAPALGLYSMSNSRYSFFLGLSSAEREKLAWTEAVFLSYQRAQVDRFRREAPGARVIEMDADHYGFIDQEAEVLREMRSFLAGHGG